MALSLLTFFALASPALADYSVERVAGGFDKPVALTFDGDGRWWVAEKDGALKVFTPGKSEPRLVLDLSEEIASGGDRGLLGLAADKGWDSNPYLYLLYTAPSLTDNKEWGASVGRLERVRVAPNGSISERKIILGTSRSGCTPPDPQADCLPADFHSHGPGAVRAAEDGTIWVSSGEAGRIGIASDLSLRALNPNSLAGKIIHVNRNGDGLRERPYCPGENNLRAACARIFAMGFRQPFRFTLSPEGYPVVGDVGEGVFEEISMVKPGLGYGWPCREAVRRMKAYLERPLCKSLPAINNQPPFLYYKHGKPTNDAVVAGPIMKSEVYPELSRMLIYADYARGFMKWVNPYNADQGGTVLEQAGTVVDLQEAPDGSLVWVNLGFMGGTAEAGFIARLSTEPVPEASLNKRFGRLPLTVKGQSSYPESTWDWGDGTPSEGAEHTYRQEGLFTVRVFSGGEVVDSFRVKAGFEPRSIGISGPSRVAAGKMASLRLSRPARWSVTLMHSEHAHPLISGKGSRISFRATNDHGLDSYYLVTATGSGEFAAAARRKLRYISAPFSVAGPRGLSVEIAGENHTLPYEGREAVGRLFTLAAPTEAELGGKLLSFRGWNIGGGATRQVLVPRSGLRLKLRYR